MFQHAQQIVRDGALGSLKTHDHPCSLYETQAELRQQFVPYLQAGLALHEKCIYFIDENSREFVIEAMQENGFDLSPYLHSRQFEIVSTADAHLQHGFFSENKMLAYWTAALNDAKALGFKALRAAVEMTWALSGKPGCDTLAPYEARLTKLMRDRDASIICMYSRKKFPPEKVKAVIHAHPLVVTDSVVLTNTACAGPDKFIEGCPNLDVQAILDNLALIHKLTAVNAELEKQTEYCQGLYCELHQLARVVSHEMQAPLNLIISYLRLLTARYSEKLGPDADDFMRVMMDSAQLLILMIDDLWTYARVDSGENDSEDLASIEILGEALQELAELIQQRNAEIIYKQMPRVHFVRRNLRFILRALIQNACQHCPLGRRPRIEIAAEDTAAAWRFSVKDNGKGIDAVYSSEVFKMYRRLDAKPGKQGTGMGLPIARKMVENEGGNIWFDSQPGKGSTFYFEIPKSAKVRYLSKAAFTKERSASARA